MSDEEQDAERDAFHASQRRLELRAKFWEGFIVGALVQGAVLIALRMWLG